MILSCCLTLAAQAQMGKFFSTEDQLSSSFVTQVYVDNDGFLWTTTRNGINRYDGYQFRTFRRENGVEHTLASNYVNAMMQDRHGLFYFGMYGALQTWDGEQFHHVRMLNLNGNPSKGYATCFLERANGDVLAGTSGLGVMKFKDMTTAQQMGGVFARLHTVNALLEDSRKRLWMIADQSKLYCYDGKELKTYAVDQRELLMQGLCEDKEGHIYIGTDNGLYCQKGEQFVHVDVMGHNNVATLYCNRYGGIMAGYDGRGLAIYEPESGQVLDNPFFSQEVDLSKSKVYSITEDHDGNIWLGLLQKGIYRLPFISRGFQYMGYKLGSRNTIGTACVISVHIDRQRRTWVGTDKDGLYILDKNGKLVRHLLEGYPSSVMTIAEHADGRIWIGSYGEGGGWIDPVTFRYQRMSYPADEHLVIMDIEADSEGRLWMATLRHGVLCVLPGSSEVKTYEMVAGADEDRQVNSIVNNYVSQIKVSSDGRRLYVASSMGVCCLDIASDSWTETFGANTLNYSTPVRCVYEDQGILWYGTNDGLCCYDLNTKETKTYTKSSGLADNGIAAIECDQNGGIWVCTDHGLSCLNPKTGLSQNYFIDDGLQSNEFSDGAVCLFSDGTMVMGGTGGITWFRPQDIRQSQWNAHVQLTAFTINGEQVNQQTLSGGEHVTDTTVIASDRFQLGYHDNSFGIQFSTLTYENPEHISYHYSINGEPFIELPAGVNELTFSHLPPGIYRFRVKGTRNSSETPERNFTVIVRSPWYRSAWAYFFYSLIIGLFLWQYLAYRRHREQSQLRLQAHIHAEELSEAKIRFFMNISHDIRTPMTLILTPLQSLIKKETDPERKGVYETIRRNAERILSLINQMMDLRKIDKGQMQMRMSETDLVPFIGDIYTLFQGQARTRQIHFVYEHDAEQLPVWIDRSNFDKVIVNVISNAFKYTKTGGEIAIRLTHTGQQAVITVWDDGEQIPADKLEKIFERFYQMPSQTNDRTAGTGIGLDLTRSLVELHHGTITARNVQRGCEFIISIPLGNAHLQPEEMIADEEQPVASPLAAELQEPDRQEEQVLAQEPPADNGRPHIVIAEDDDEIRNYLKSEFSQDYEVSCCVNGREALAEVYRIRPQLVISDVMMPEMDGNALCAQLKLNPATGFIPVILLTAKNRDEDRLEGLETGADAYVVKPFNMDILKRMVQNLISSRRMLKLKYERTDDLEEQIDQIQLKSPDEKLLVKIMECVKKNIANSDLNIDMISDEVGISRVHLHRKMKELTGQTPHDFIRSIRLKKAAQLLSEQGMNITEVMYACGFANAASFSTIFRKFYGMSPRDYMREHQER